MLEVLFFIAALGALGGAAGVVFLKNPFYSVLSLVVHLIFLAVLFLLLEAQFLAAAQIVVYAGAVMVIYVFVAAYVGGIEEPLFDPIPRLRVLGPILAAAVFIEISIAVLGSSLVALGTEGAPDLAPGFGTPAAIGLLLLEDFLVAFEVASLLLLVTAVAAIVLAGRKPGEERVES